MVEIESVGGLTRSEVAAFFREFAEELDDDGTESERKDVPDIGGDEDRDQRAVESKRITFIVGGNSATVTLPNSLAFDVDVDSRSPVLSSAVSQKIEFEISWEIEDPDDDLVDDRIKIE